MRNIHPFVMEEFTNIHEMNIKDTQTDRHFALSRDSNSE